jgi:hypothetical protein
MASFQLPLEPSALQSLKRPSLRDSKRLTRKLKSEVVKQELINSMLTINFLQEKEWNFSSIRDLLSRWIDT